MPSYHADDYDSQVTVLYGRGLAYQLRKKTQAQKSVLAVIAFDTDPTSIVTDLTERQQAALFGVSVASLRAARSLSRQDRLAVLDGTRPLIGAKDRLVANINKVGTEAAFDLLCKAL